MIERMPPSRKDALKRPTISDVARLAGVGTMTVSRAINGHPYVSESVAKKVQAAIRKLNYTPNAAAQILNGRPSATIGLIVPDLADPFFAVLTHAVQATARQHKYQVWIAASNSDAAIEKLELEQMVRRAVDGILVVSSKPNDTYFKVVTSTGVPMVAIDRPLEGVATDSIEVENYKGSREAVEHLIEHGRKKILCVGYNAQQSTIKQRMLGYREAVEAANLPVLIEVALGPADSLSLGLGKSLLKRVKPDAIFALNNIATLHSIEILNELKIHVPTQIALIGFDDMDAWRVTNPPITVVRQPVQEMGSLAVKILLDRTLSVGKSITRTILPTRLIIRSSCGCPPSAHVHLHVRSS
jgi:LacI family transcriptional regulator